MGKDWFYWGGGGSSTSTKSGGSGRSTKIGRVNGNHTASGCMNAVFQLFDFHHFQFPLHHERQVPPLQPGSFLSEKPIRGVEAPRNSLEMEEAFASFPSSTMKGVESFDIPMGIQVKTTRDDSFSSSPESKTPNLVARLMGLDILPPAAADTYSTSSSSSTSCINHPSKSHLHQAGGQCRSTNRVGDHRQHLFDTDIIGTRSLPETPRISSSRRSDVEYHHRLSVQINNKENDLAATKGVRRRDQVLRSYGDHDHEGLRPGGTRYTRQIVNQVKEKVSRRVGLDITNTIRNRSETIKGRNDDGDDHVVLLRVRKPSKGLENSSSCDESSPSPRLRKKIQVTATHSPKLSLQSPLSLCINRTVPQCGKVPLKQQSQPAVLRDEDQKHEKIASHDHQGHSSPLFKKHPASSNACRNKQEEPFVWPLSVTYKLNLLDKKKSKKTPLSSELLNTNIVPTLFPVKRDYPSSAARFPQKTAHGGSDAVSSKRSPQRRSTSQVTHQLQANKHVQDLTCLYNSSSSSTGGTAFHYITRILKHTGIDGNTPLSFPRWHSLSQHPLINPFLFNHLEISFPAPTTTTTVETTTTLIIDSQLKHRCIRKLIFQLVDEILEDILKPYVSLNPWGYSVRFGHSIGGSELIEKICTKIRSFPSADCQVLEDIDALIENDLGRSDLRGAVVALEEEGEAIVTEVEKDLVESLLHEMTMGEWGQCGLGNKGWPGSRDGIL